MIRSPLLEKALTGLLKTNNYSFINLKRFPLSMKLSYLATVMLIATACTSSRQETANVIPAMEQTPICESYSEYFKTGTSLNVNQTNGKDSIGAEVAKRHFNTIVAENCMKSAEIHPTENEYNWEDADNFVKFGTDNNMWIVGHCLVWHSQLSPWFCVDEKGENVSPDVLKQRLRDHIHTIVGRYKGKVHAWDVVNETVEDDGSYRKTPFYQILGEEYIPLAFQYAHEADPDAQLIINDYSMSGEKKRERYVQIVNDLKKRGLRVDAIGMQGHNGMDYPDYKEFEKSIEAFAGTGCDVMITELDFTVLPTVVHGAAVENNLEYSQKMNPYADGLTPEIDNQWNDRVAEFMKLLIKHSDKITRVNFWGVNDADSWRNDWPMRGRTDYPLAIDRSWNVKPFVEASLK